MNTRRMSARRVNEKVVYEGVPSRGEQVPLGGEVFQGEQVSIANQGNEVWTSVPDLVKEEHCTTVLHNNMTLSRLIMYTQPIEESKLERRGRGVRRGRPGGKNQPKFKKRAPNQDVPSDSKIDHKVRDSPSIATKERDVKKSPYNGPDVGE
ncbi:hypothetical protein EJD97_012338 [Solanum chilense]|uniref:Uncharacterized protein n=1 Tax=Solanum chilense TaxID=4083 RepID=A0A6N2CB62_SOLCI|nr:hypothetical protein EJD97_012338 [Solanum chilense]